MNEIIIYYGSESIIEKPEYGKGKSYNDYGRGFYCTEYAHLAKEYILKNFPVDTKGIDIIKGYRADDSYFSYAKDFLQNGISVRRLSQVMKLGNLGNQIVLISPKAFEQIKFLGYEEAPQKLHFPLRKNRDELARIEYLSDCRGGAFNPDDILMIDILRGAIKADDSRLQ